MQKLKLAGLSILSGLLMGISWPATGNLAPVFFIALIPLLYVEYIISQNSDKYKSRHLFFYAYLTFIVFNTYTTWWIWHASSEGMIMAEVLYSLFMAVTFLWFHNIKKRLGDKKGYFALVVLWIGFEWLHFNWEFSHPWNPFGNTFANYPKIIQWYEYTGVMGGTLWILVVNILFFKLFKKIIILGESIKSNIKTVGLVVTILIVPTVFSVITYYNYVEEENPIEIVVIQPNIDPYTEKFGGMTEADQIDRILSLARKKITSNTKFVVAPETSIPRSSRENEFEANYGIKEIRKFIQEYPHINFIIGATSYINYNEGGKRPTTTARQVNSTKVWYDVFNTALLMDTSPNIQTYHKSKLVLGVEKLPYPALFAPLEKFAIDLGGTFGSIGTEAEAHNLISEDIHIAPVICYESIYGEYVASYVKKGANLIFIITNDGWWKDTPGYKQHLAYARLRAIETRRSIARSANTGTSCYINQRGDIIDATPWWKPDVIINTLNVNNKTTFYSENGDLLGRVAAAIAVLLLLWSWTIKIKGKLNKQN
ncbi:MAG: apolipoprotein N-acyltransferase [Flavobacteriales bacterium]|nr:MAG: apolipoprotein N-acyltransferase [Flavobacteriales bacterium]